MFSEKLEEAGAGNVGRPRYRKVLDLWFSVYPIWTGFLHWELFTKGFIRPSGPGGVIMVIALAAGLGTVLLCLAKLDRKDRGVQKAIWYAVALFPCLGASVCYFAHLRRVGGCTEE